MNKLTKIFLDNGEMALYLDGHYLGSEDVSGEKMSLNDIADALQKVPGICVNNVSRPCPENDEWSWNDVVKDIFPESDNYRTRTEVTVEAFIARLSEYPADALCCGTFWLDEDFLEVDAALTPDEIQRAMEIATKNHDCNVGYNWDFLTYAAERAKE